MLKRTIMLLAVFTLMATTMVWAQNGLTIFGAYAMPQGDFGDKDYEEEDAGLAKAGFAGGIDLVIPFSSPNLKFIASAAYISNSVDTENIEDDLESFMEEYDIPADDAFNIDVKPWINIPVMGGLRFDSPLSPTSKFYIMGLFGVNFATAGERKIELDLAYTDSWGDQIENTVREKFTFEKTSQTGFCFGGGIILNRSLNLGVRYYNLGKVKFEGSYESYERYYDSYYGEPEITDESEDFELEQNISILLITLGINL